MLKAIQIKNFRSCKDVTASNLPAIVALIGRNAAGKTNVLRGIEWAAKIASGDATEEMIFRHVMPMDRQSHISMSVELKDRTYSYEVGFQHSGQSPTTFKMEMAESLFVQDKQGGREEVCTRKGENIKLSGNGDSIKVGATVPCMLALTSLVQSSSPIVKTIRPLLDFFRRVRYYPLDEYSDADQSTITSATMILT